MEGKLSKEVLKSIIGQKDSRVDNLFMSEEDFKGLADPLYEIKKPTSEEVDEELLDVYRNIVDILKFYCDWKEDYYPIVACWIIGTYFHDKMITYPYLYFNASKESGKSRSVRLITYMSKNGEMVNSMTEAVLFRTKGTLGIDEFEKASRKGNENLMELLNSAYKRGTKVKRIKKVKSQTGDEMVVEDFDVFRPICLANIWGMDTVLEDRCLPMYLEKTTRENVSNLLEIWEFDEKLLLTLNLLKKISGESVVSSVVINKENTQSQRSVVSLQNVYVDWNTYLISNYITTRTNNNTKLHLFEKIRDSKIKGRMLELSFPLVIIADMIHPEIVDTIIESLRKISIEKSQEAFLENKDIFVVDMVSQEVVPTRFQSMKILVEKFKQFINYQPSKEDDWLNEKWLGRSIKRNMLAKEKKRTHNGIEILLDIEKAQEKIRMFR